MLLRSKLLALLILTGMNSFSQSNTVSSGGNLSGATGTVSYTIGQIDYSSQSSANGNINQGVQQPYEIYGTSGLHELSDDFQLTVGPNPTIDILNLTCNSDKSENLQFYLTDSNGKTILLPNKLSGQAIITMSNYPVGTYFLIIQNSLQEIKTFKIIKN